MRISDWSSDVCSSDLSIEGGAARGAALPGSRHVGRRPGAWLPLARFPLDDLDRLLKAAANTVPEVGVVHRRYSRAKSSSPRLIASGRGSVVNHQSMPQEAITAKSCPPVAGPRTSIAVIIARMVARVNVIGRLA